LDSHADTCVVGSDSALLIHDFDRPVRVHGYKEDIGPTPNCRTVSAVVAYDHPGTGEVYMLVIHQAILIEQMTTNLLSPMQMRDNDLHVNDEPKFMVLNPTENHHAIHAPALTNKDELRIPLSIQGVTSYFPSRKPTRQEYDNAQSHLIIELTSESPEWDPSTTRFQEQEDAMTDSNGKLIDRPLKWTADRMVASLHTFPQQAQADNDFGAALLGSVRVTARENRPVSVKSLTSGKRKYAVGPKTLAKNWSIGLSSAQRTIDATTQKGLRTILHPTLSRRFRTNDRQLRYRRLACDMFTDTLESRTVSWFRKNRYAQVFSTRYGWARVFPMRKKSDAHHGLSLMARRDGIPVNMIMDGSKEQNLGEFRSKSRTMGIHLKTTEPHSPWQNAAEGTIREVKRGAGRKAAQYKSPAKLWDHCIELEGYVRSNTALDIYELQGQVPETILSGQTADISPFVECHWYEWVKYWDNYAMYPDAKEQLGRWLGPSIDTGPAMTAKVLKSNGQLLHLSSYRKLTEEEMANPIELKERDEWDRQLTKKLGGPVTDADLQSIDIDVPTPEYDLYDDDVDGSCERIPNADDITPEDADNYVGAEVTLPLGGTIRAGTVKRRARSLETGELTGTKNSNPILDTRSYEVEFPDGEVAEYAANVIAENMFAQCDSEGNQFRLMSDIVDHKSDKRAVQFADRFIIVNGKQHHRKTTVGWKLCIQWKDGSTSWERLADVKESYPIEVAEYATAQGIDHEPAFSWWVPYILRKRNRIIAAVNKRYHKRTHKFGFEVPKTVKRALEIDTENGNTLWRDSIAKEMTNVRIAFKIQEDGVQAPPGYQYMDCHMIFDIKLDGFKRKARMVAGGHMTDTPAVMTYASVVSKETVRIALTLAALNDLEVKASDVQNAYLTAPCEEKIYTTLGTEFGEDAGKTAIIVRALYGLKSAGGSFSRHLADCMRNLGYTSCKADPDLWMKATTRPEDGLKYYAYVLLYVDDCLAVSHDATHTLEELDKFFQMKPGSIGDPDIYLGAKLRQVQLDNGVYAWGQSSAKYVQEAVRNAADYLRTNFGGRTLPKRATAPWPTNYRAETDESPELNHHLASYYQSQVGVLHWMVELGRIDMITEVSLLASHMALPREGHLDAIFHLYGYLNNKSNARIVFDPTYPDVDMSIFQEHEWKSVYGNVQEPIPLDKPEPRGKEVDIRLYVDSDHAGDERTRRSRTGFFVFLNSALIQWLSRRQPTIETSVFGAEFVAMKHGMETVRGIRYKLRMMGVPISGPTFVYGDNMSVIHNTQRPDSTLKKKSNQICYHAMRESVAMNESLTGHIPTAENPADLATKVLGGGQKRNHLVSKLLYDICDNI
jgi:hypothetical protein